jgi:hypothetical protein
MGHWLDNPATEWSLWLLIRSVIHAVCGVRYGHEWEWYDEHSCYYCVRCWRQTTNPGRRR